MWRGDSSLNATTVCIIMVLLAMKDIASYHNPQCNAFSLDEHWTGKEHMLKRSRRRVSSPRVPEMAAYGSARPSGVRSNSSPVAWELLAVEDRDGGEKKGERWAPSSSLPRGISVPVETLRTRVSANISGPSGICNCRCCFPDDNT